jgi:Na+-transporting methylmalonyl-CoA/oxaloacetate decarboxylase gamma subunit
MNPLEITFDLSAISTFSIFLSVVGYVTVFIALVILYYVFAAIPKLINIQVRHKLKRQGKVADADKELEMVGEVNAAISMALFLFFEEQHDEESRKMTVKNIQKIYSPWSSKIYNVNDYYKKIR